MDGDDTVLKAHGQHIVVLGGQCKHKGYIATNSQSISHNPFYDMLSARKKKAAQHYNHK